MRWQVRKSVPFPLEQAQVSWTRAWPTRRADYVVTVARQDIVADYEQAVAAAGVQVGLVDLATFNLVNLVLAGDAAATARRLAARARDARCQHDGDRARWRAAPLPPPAADGEGSLADLGHQTAMYYEDRLNGRGLSRAVLAARDVGPAASATCRPSAAPSSSGSAGHRGDRPAGAGPHRAERGIAGDRAAIAAPVGVLLRERVG